MAFDEAINHDSPGAVLADAVFELYQKVLANPEDYPRGMHVRLMLGNSPPIAELEVDAQLWYFLKDIQEAGFEKMIDPDVGWKLEVANYYGAWPHSHVKTMVIDGKTAVASGFNHEYKPLPVEHPSGQGLGDTDTGIIITGPVAQHTRVVFEQLWDGAVVRHCDDLSVENESWQDTCEDTPGVPADIAEAMRFYPTEEDTVAFSMFRSHVYDESDQQIIDAFSSAGESIDVAQAMFSMPSICILNHFFDVCSYYQALPYMRALMRGAENGAHLRLLLTPYPSQNIENVIAAEIFLQEAADRGLADQVELRFFDTFLHSKSALIEDEFLIMGSQNLHYSAFERGEGLAEYNLGTSDPMAVEQYKRMYEYYWDRSETE
jgi:cardiolipin synthase